MWLRAYSAAGGDFRHVESIKKLIMELKPGVKHRVKDRYERGITSPAASWTITTGSFNRSTARESDRYRLPCGRPPADRIRVHTRCIRIG
jgi:hypothetical protein